MLIVNGFLASAKFDDLYALLLTAFSRRGIALEMHRATDFVSPVGTPPWAPYLRPDFVLFWDKDATLARRFEDAGVRVYNSSSSIAICDDKILTAQALARAGLPTPATIVAPMTFEGIGYVGLPQVCKCENVQTGNAQSPVPATISDSLPTAEECTFGRGTRPRVTASAYISDFLRQAGEQLGFPMVIKEACGSFGAQVYLAEDLAAAARIIATFGHKRFLIQEYVGIRNEELGIRNAECGMRNAESILGRAVCPHTAADRPLTVPNALSRSARTSRIPPEKFLIPNSEFLISPASRSGRDLRVNVVAGRVIASILRENPSDFRSNVTNGGTATAYSPSPEIAELAIAAARAVGADFAGVDILMPEDRPPLVCEVNSNPSFRSTLDATGVDLAAAIVDAVGQR